MNGTHDRLAEIAARTQALPQGQRPDDIRWLIQELLAARAHIAETDHRLTELRARLDDAGSLMATTYVASAIGYTL
ncbi:hypothetical protein [Streptomyces sp. TE33382]